MKIAVKYYSKTGNTKKFAIALADKLKVSATTIDQALTEDVGEVVNSFIK